jgi:hypothetical protein
MILFCWVHVFGHDHPFASLLVKTKQNLKSSKQMRTSKQATKKERNKDIAIEWQEMIE